MLTGTFLIVALTIRSLPPGSQAMTRDVKDAYRTVPLHPSQWAGTILRHPDPDAFYVNTANCFGLSSAGGIWGQVADVLCDLFRSSGYGPVSKWVDDFLFFRIPTKSLVSYNAYRANIRSQLTPHQTHSRLFFQGSTLPDGSNSEYDDSFTFPLRNIAGSHHYAYSATQLDAFSAALGIPWKHSKSTSFASTVTYLGFNWHLDSYSIELAPSKHSKYRLALTHFRASTFHSLLDLQQIYGKLLHITLIVPRARVYLASFEAMLALNQTTPSQRRRSSKRMLIDLDWWGDFLAQPRLLFPLPNFSPYLPLAAYSDASSGFGIGLSYNGRWAAFSYQRHFKPGSHDIAWAEALGVLLLLHFLQLHLPQSLRFSINCDNQVVTKCFLVGRSRNPLVNSVLKDIFSLLFINKWDLQLNYIPGCDNPADAPSRGRVPNNNPLPPFPLPSSLTSIVTQCHPSQLSIQTPVIQPFVSTSAIPTSVLSEFELHATTFLHD